MTQQHNYEHTVTFSFLIFFVESEENEGKRDRVCCFAFLGESSICHTPILAWTFNYGLGDL